MLLPQSFLDNEDRCLNVSPRDAHEGADYARLTYDYLVISDYGKKTAQAVSLSIEEIIALLTGQHDKKNKVHIDLFVTAEDECIRIRIRSYGKLFDPLSKEQQEEQWDLDDIRKTIVSRVADEVEYNTSLGVNNIIVTVNTGDRNA